MKVPLMPIQILSIYKIASGKQVLLPSRMALCTPDTYTAVMHIKEDVENAGGQLYLSDLFRSYDMQLQAHYDYVSKKKKAFSPAPGGSMHEAGRAFDMDLANIKISLKMFWEIAARHGVLPIINKPDSSMSEAWHFDCRGSHALVYDYYASGKAQNFKPYQAMAASAILSVGVQHDSFKGKEREALIQFMIVRLGKEIGNIDGLIGAKTKGALVSLGLQDMDLDQTVAALENIVQITFPDEYRLNQVIAFTEEQPEHVIS
jgi:D-alanyl-D-alanine dipeptidase